MVKRETAMAYDDYDNHDENSCVVTERAFTATERAQEDWRHWDAELSVLHADAMVSGDRLLQDDIMAARRLKTPDAAVLAGLKARVKGVPMDERPAPLEPWAGMETWDQVIARVKADEQGRQS